MESVPEPKLGSDSRMKKKRKMSPQSLANLRPPIKPGEVLNPSGVNRKGPWTETYSEIGERLYPEVLRRKFNKEIGAEVLLPGATFREAIAVRRLLEATQIGGTSAAKEIVDRIEGKTTDLRGRTSARERISRVLNCRRRLQERRNAGSRRDSGDHRRNQ